MVFLFFILSYHTSKDKKATGRPDSHKVKSVRPVAFPFLNFSLFYSSVKAWQTRSWKFRPVEVWRTPWFMMAKQRRCPFGAVA